MDWENAHPPSCSADADASSIPIGGTQGTRFNYILCLHLVFWSGMKYLWPMIFWLILSKIFTLLSLLELF